MPDRFPARQRLVRAEPRPHRSITCAVLAAVAEEEGRAKPGIFHR